MAGVGIVIGIAVALSVTRLASARLFGVTPRDPATLLTASVLLLLVAIAASLAPALRAARANPIVALPVD